MGLDMLLYVEDLPDLKITWRKANAIHGWFVSHVQNNVDDCKNYPVTRAQLQELHDLCESVLKTKSSAGNPSAEQLLPTMSGFFFGDTEYSKYYYEELSRTKKGLKKILDHPHANKRATYSSSW